MFLVVFYCNMSGKKWVGRSGYFFPTHMHISADHYGFCIHIKEKKKLKLLIASANFVLFVLLMSDYQFLFCFVNIFLVNTEKKLYSCFFQ